MPKKHRVKRQQYVEHLLKLEKERDAYLAKRQGGKRSREEEELAATHPPVLEPQSKRHRREVKEEESEKSEELPVRHPPAGRPASVKDEEEVPEAERGRKYIKRRY